MPRSINFIKALHGDAILVKVSEENSSINLLVDGGPGRAFRARQPGFPGDAELRAVLDDIRAKGQAIDLLIMTHVDDDHIGGVISAFEHPDYLSALTKSVIFNSGQLIHAAFNLDPNPSNNIKGNFQNLNRTSIKQGVTLEGFLDEKGIWIKRIFKQGDRHSLGRMTFFFLSPNDVNLKVLSEKWEKEKISPNTAKNSTDYSKSYDELLKDDIFESDHSVHNGSSISFYVEIGEKKIMMLGDSFSETVEEGLEKMGYTEKNPLQLDIVKISHHGSQKNTSCKFLKIIRSNKFVITTNGSQHGLPNKLTLARIHKIHPEATIYFNYPSMINKIYSVEEIFSLGRRIQGIAGDILIE